jgi:toxin ParE1/3/4
MTRVIVSAKARGDFRDIISYLSRNAGSAVAKRYSVRIDDCVVLIAERPRIGAPRPGLGPGVRIRTIRPYVLIYSFSGESVEILRLLHGKRKITRRKLPR